MSVRLITKTINLLTPITRANFKNKACDRHFSTLFSSSYPQNQNEADKPKKKKTVIIPRITLIQGADLTVTTLEEAQKISKRRDLKLVKILDLDTKTQRPVYKLMTGSEYHAEDLKQRALKKENKQNSIKGEKMLLINYKITDHDLETHVNKIHKWINKMYEVRVVINGDINHMDKAESVYKTIESSLDKDLKILQKRQKGSDIKFQIIPTKKKQEDEKL